MPDQLTAELMSRQLNDPQAAWQKASSIGADPTTDINNPTNWKLGMMPNLPGSGWMKRILEILSSSDVQPSKADINTLPQSPTLGEHLPEFTPVGGEGALNAGRAGAVEKAINPIERVYLNILRKGGR